MCSKLTQFRMVAEQKIERRKNGKSNVVFRPEGHADQVV